MNELERITNWYSTQCNGEWEHSFGIHVETLDNPGWLIRIDLSDTELEGKLFNPITRGDSETSADWIHCKVEAQKFVGAGGVGNLPDMLNIFLKWAEA